MCSDSANPLFANMKQRLKMAIKFITLDLLIKQFTTGPYLLSIIAGNFAAGHLNEILYQKN